MPMLAKTISTTGAACGRTTWRRLAAGWLGAMTILGGIGILMLTGMRSLGRIPTGARLVFMAGSMGAATMDVASTDVDLMGAGFMVVPVLMAAVTPLRAAASMAVAGVDGGKFFA